MRVLDCESSSNVEGLSYDEATKELTAKFRGGAVYVYDGVPAEVVDRLQAADSKGSYLRREIQTSFSGRRVS